MTPFTCCNCSSPCDCDYLCPGCHGAVCDRCVHLGNEMKMLNRTFRCAKCKELATKRNEKEASMNKDGGALKKCQKCGMPYPPEPAPLRYFRSLGWGEIEVRRDGWGEFRPRRGWFWRKVFSWIADDAAREGEDG